MKARFPEKDAIKFRPGKTTNVNLAIYRVQPKYSPLEIVVKQENRLFSP
ncbi:hypothetical protein K239x_12260 [Planctomycetes bacterium K23_9]|uniref:Uncharacterized protein n=1 Tax=Stieleria marina TaxID=1930275 RepID=A0A517NQ89_9BACT|nr:hypothetical protein K239x_12260 [Planctomycetes bacterium K23_9]